jgi:hypothetical protein
MSMRSDWRDAIRGETEVMTTPHWIVFRMRGYLAGVLWVLRLRSLSERVYGADPMQSRAVIRLKMWRKPRKKAA